MKLIRAFLFCLTLALSGAAHADTITFDDLAGSGVSAGDLQLIAVPNGYDGLNWKNFYVYDTSSAIPSGYLNGTISPHNVAGIPTFDPPTLGTQYFPPATISATTPFYFLSAYFTAGWLNGMTLEVEGKNGTSVAFDETFTVNATNTSFLAFPAVPLTEVDFTTSGGDGLHHPYIIATSTMAVDNLTIDFVTVPEAASTVLLLAASAGGLALLRKRLA